MILWLSNAIKNELTIITTTTIITFVSIQAHAQDSRGWAMMQAEKTSYNYSDTEALSAHSSVYNEIQSCLEWPCEENSIWLATVTAEDI